jgi:hypothetical protein
MGLEIDCTFEFAETPGALVRSIQRGEDRRITDVVERPMTFFEAYVAECWERQRAVYRSAPAGSRVIFRNVPVSIDLAQLSRALFFKLKTVEPEERATWTCPNPPGASFVSEEAAASPVIDVLR